MPRKITVYDEAGRPVEVDADRWGTEVLPGLLEEAWNDPELLATRVLAAVEDGLADAVRDAAEHLVEIDERLDRAIGLLALVLAQVDETDEAEGVLLRYLADHGDSALVLAQLAELIDDRDATGERQQVEALYRRALQVDPNCVFALERWLRCLDARGGESERLRGIREIAHLDGSFWPQLLLARRHLEAGEIDRAERIYDEVWDHVVDDAAALVRVSGDLGECGYPDRVLQRVRPVWDVAVHGPVVGLNLARACFDEGALAEGREILREVDALGLPHLAPEIARLEDDIAGGDDDGSDDDEAPTAEVGPLRVAVVPFDGPVWAACFSEPGPLVASEVPAGERIALLAFSDLRAAQRGDELGEDEVVEGGRLSRGLPLCLADALSQETDAKAFALIPVVRGAGPILAGEPWDADWFLSEIPPQERPSVLVQGAIGTSGIELRLLDVDEERTCAVLRFAPPPGRAGLMPSLSMFRTAVRDALERTGHVRPRPRPSPFAAPALAPELEEPYLRAVDQLHAQILVAGGLVDRDSIIDEAGAFENLFQLADKLPESGGATLLACGGVLAAHGYGSSYVGKYKERLLRLLRRDGPGGTLSRLAEHVEERL